MVTCCCRFCGKIFLSHSKKSTCKGCQKLEDAEFEKIKDYLLAHPNSNAIDISEDLDMSPLDIIRYIDEGRLSISKGSFEG